MAMFRGVKHANTQIQRQIQIEIRKYNYSGNHTIQLHFYHTYFWKALCTRTSMTMLQGVRHANTQIQRQIQIEIRKYNYSGNTLIYVGWAQYSWASIHFGLSALIVLEGFP